MRFQLVLTAAALASACGSVAGSGTSPSPSAPAGAVVVTMASDHQTVTAHVGDRIQIALGEQYKWQLDPPDGVVLARPVQNYLAGPRDAGDLARERHRTLDDQRNRQCELPERAAVPALRDPVHRDRRCRSLDRSAYFTTTVPTIPISSWISQMYRYVPAAVNVTL